MPTVWLQRLHTRGAAAAVAAADGSDDAAVSAAAGDGAVMGPAAAAGGAAGGASKAQGKSATAAAAAAAAATVSSSSAGSYLPHSMGSKGPHWLRYQCGSGRTMQPSSSQDVPAFAAHALATLAGTAGGVGASAVEQGSRAGAAVSRNMANIKVGGAVCGLWCEGVRACVVCSFLNCHRLFLFALSAIVGVWKP
jgi:hypothetical protein